MELFNTPIFNIYDISRLLFRFFFNTFFVWIIAHCFYYRTTRKLNFYFTFILISISVFFLIYMLGGVKMKMGMALGLFAIFGIIRYRTELVSVREMTYLFVIISLSVINALSLRVNYLELLIANIIFVGAIWLFEAHNRRHRTATKHILYDRIDKIQPDRHVELIEEIKERTGLDITDIEVGAINYLQDSVMLRVHYRISPDARPNTVDSTLRLPRED